MDLESLRNFVQEHSTGVRLRMVSGEEYDIPHRDFVFFGPPRETPAARRGPHATSFLLWEDHQHFKLINALLVTEASPPPANGRKPRANGKGGSA